MADELPHALESRALDSLESIAARLKEIVEAVNTLSYRVEVIGDRLNEMHQSIAHDIEKKYHGT